MIFRIRHCTGYPHSKKVYLVITNYQSLRSCPNRLERIFWTSTIDCHIVPIDGQEKKLVHIFIVSNGRNVLPFSFFPTNLKLLSFSFFPTNPNPFNSHISIQIQTPTSVSMMCVWRNSYRGEGILEIHFLTIRTIISKEFGSIQVKTIWTIIAKKFYRYGIGESRSLVHQENKHTVLCLYWIHIIKISWTNCYNNKTKKHILMIITIMNLEWNSFSG